jgi:ankyrin repeat protein
VKPVDAAPLRSVEWNKTTGENKVRRPMTIAVVLAVLLTAPAYAQTTDFFELVKTGTPQNVQRAINSGAEANSPDKDGKTPLMYAAGYNQNVEVITVLVKAGADIEAIDKNSMTPLMYAAWNNQNPDEITVLLKAGANLKAHDKDGFDALTHAAYSNPNPEVITTLLKAGADVNAQGSRGWTPLMLAAYSNPNPEVITTLLEAGAKANIKNSEGRIAFDYAQKNEKLKGSVAYMELEKASR